MGTSVGTRVFTQFGWRPAAALSVAWTGFQLFILFIRGPHVKRYTWFGWEGGLEPRRRVVEAKKKKAEEAEMMEKEEREKAGVSLDDKESQDDETLLDNLVKQTSGKLNFCSRL